MNWFILTIGIINLVFAIFALVKIPKTNFLRNYFTIFAFITSLWLFSNYILVLNRSFIFYKIAYSFGSMMMASALVLITSFFNRKRLTWVGLSSIYLIGIVFAGLTLANDIFIKYNPQLPNNVEYTKLFILYLSYFLVSLVYCLTIMFMSLRKFKGIIKNQSKYIFIGVLMFGLFSFTMSFLLPNIGFPEFINFDTCGSLFFVGFTGYAIFRYQLMDVSVVIKRSSIYALMIFFVTATYLAVIFAFENIFRDYLGLNSLLPRIVASIVLALTFLPIRNFFEKFIDKIFFKTKYEYTVALKKFSDELVKVLDLRELMDTIIFNISHTLNVDHIILLLYDHKSKMYKPKAYLGVGKPIRHISLSHRHKLISWLKANRSIAIRSRFYTENGHYNRDYHIIYKQMTMFKSEIGLPLIFNNEMIGILTLSEKKNGELYSTEDLNLLGSFANEAAIAFSNAIAYDNLKKTYIGTIEAFVKAIEAKDIYTRGHSERVLKISMAIATEMGLPREQIDTLRYASILHDVGKIAIEDRILNKQGALDTFEYEVIKQHPIIGANIVSTISFLSEAIDVVKHHHEHFNGNGYPSGLKADNIPLLSRIISVADTFDAITSNRLYRQAVDNSLAVEEISRCSESQFDPFVVEAFVSAYRKNRIS